MLISPAHPSRNPRLVKEAEALREAGCAVRIVFGDYTDWGARMDPPLIAGFEAATPVTFGPVRAATSRYLRQSLAHRAAAAIWRRAGSARRSAQLAARAFHPAAGDLRRTAIAAGPADLFIAHNVAALPAAAAAAARHGAAYAFDAEDFHQGDPPAGAEQADEIAKIAAIEAAHLPGAAYVTAAAPMIAAAYADAYAIPEPAVVLNVFSLSEAPSERAARPLCAERRSLYWFSQTIGPQRGLECAIKAVARSKTRPSLTLRGDDAHGYGAQLMEIARSCGAADLVAIVPPEPPSRMVRCAAEHDAGFVGETGHTRNRSIMLTNKQFTYFAAGAPALMSDIPSHERFSKEAGEATRLYRTDDADSFASAIDGLLGDADALERASGAAWRSSRERYNWDAEKAIFLHEVDRALRDR